MRTRIAVPLLTAGAILAIAFSYHAYRYRRQPDDPDWLLRQADEQAWLNNWINAAPVYHRAEVLYQERNEPAKALYAHVSQMMATSEMSSFAPQIASLSDDLQLPAARDPETRLRILTIRGMLETNYDAGLATKTWTEVGELARQQHHYMLASRAMGEEGIAAFLLGDVNGAQEKVMKAYLVAKYLGDPAARVRYASVYGAGLAALKKYDRALKPLDEAIRVADMTKGVAYPSIATASKIEALGGLGRYQEALTLTNDAMARVTARHLNMHISELLRIRADIYERTGQTTLATADYQAAIDIGKKVSDWRGLLQTGGSLAALYEKQDRLEDALHTIDDAIDANKQIPDELYFLPRNLSIKARILARLGRTRESNTLYQKSADLIDSLLAHAPTANVERELITSMEQVYAGYFDSLCAQNKFAEAFRTIEKARGRFEAQSLEHVEAASPRPASDLDQKLVRLNLALLNTDERIFEQEQRGGERVGYGERIVEQLARDLSARFGRGFSRANVFQMRQFYLAYRARVQTSSGLLGTAGIVQTLSGQFDVPFPLSWSHYVRLLTVTDEAARDYYEHEALRGGWSVRDLDRQIATRAYQRLHGKAGTSVASSLPGGLNPDDHIRDPFVLEFLNLNDEYSESDLEQALILELERFLLELGNDFAFVARQKRLRIGTEWYRVDLLFFHRRLRSLLIVELKVGKFTHADAGQMNLYLNYARKHWVNPDENPPVGLILCSEHDAAVAHYSLESLGNTVLAREYELALPDEHRLAERLALTRNRLLSSRTERE